MRGNPSFAPFFGLQQSGSGFVLGDEYVVTDYGYYGNGDQLAFAVIMSWPVDLDPNLRLNDPRFDGNSGGIPLIRFHDGRMHPVELGGHVYLFIGDELRTMRVKMNEHTDTAGFSRAESLEGIWTYLQQFRVED